MLYFLSSILQTILWSTAAHGVLHWPQHVYSESTSIISPRTIPGGSPLKFCNESRSTDLYSIEQIELYPKPLYIDDVFEVHIYGTFLKNITNNATWTFTGRYGNAPANESGSVDFCKPPESIEQPDRNHKPACPPEKGFALMMFSSWVMPMFIVPGPYYFKFDAVTKEGERIYCLDSEIYLDYKDGKGP